MKSVARRLPLVNTCCCGCSLSTGTLIITVVELVLSIMQFLTAAIIAGGLSDLIDDPDAVPDDAHTKAVLQGLYALFVFLTLYNLAVIIISSCAIHGARTHSPNLLLPWLYSCLGFLFVKFVGSIVMIARASEYAKALSITLTDGNQTMAIDVNTTSIVTQGVANLFSVALGVYYFIVVFSFYTELKNGARSGFPVGGGLLGVSPGIRYQPGEAAVGFGYNAGGVGQAIVQTSHYQQPSGVGELNKDSPREKATSDAASLY